MRKVVTLQLTALGTRSWQADDNYVLSDMTVAGGASAVLSFDPALTYAALGTTTQTRFDIIAVRQSGNSSPQSVPGGNLAFPIDKDSTVYAAVSAAAAVLLYLDSIPDS